MISKVISAAVIGLEAKIVHVEVHFSKGKSKFFIVGLPDKACSESKERVSAIVKNFLGHRLPAGTFTVNLAPAEIPKSGAVYDLPIAIGILDSMGEISFDTKDKLVIGELSLDGKTRNTKAILPITDLVARKGIGEIYIPAINAPEAKLISGVSVLPVKDLSEIVNHIRGESKISEFLYDKKLKTENQEVDSRYDLSLIKGQDFAKRAFEIAASGGHNVLMSGSPGSGKSMIAKTLPSILPEMRIEESLDVTKIYSISGMLSEKQSLVKERPFRKPHHTISHVALVGGGTIPKPGEISLAHRGVLFLDEFSEFSSKTLEALRQPLEDGVVTISRAKGSVTYPARIMLVAAMNPCRCGWRGDDVRDCSCSPSDIHSYKKKISGPILDRIDMKIFVKRVEYESLNANLKSKNSKSIKQKVEKAREIQVDRFKESSIITNSEMGQKEIQKFIQIGSKSKNILKRAMKTLNLSARSYFKVLKVARTIGDLEGKDSIKSEHIAEALSYRMGEGK